MNDRELDLALDRLGVEHVRRTAPSTLRDRVHVVPLENKRRPWLPSFPTWRFPSMFSATKVLVAAAIVALFGGFLLAGVLTTNQDDEPLPAVGASPSTSVEAERANEPTSAPESGVIADLLPGVDLVAEQVEPGVFRVDSDGIRALTKPDIEEYDFLHASLVAGLDGSVWLFLKDSFFRIGDGETHPWMGSQIDWEHSGAGATRPDDIEVGPDGTLWWAGTSGEHGLRSFDGDGWSVRMEAPFWGLVREVEIDSQGTVWAASEDLSTNEVSVGRLGDDGWETLLTNQRAGWPYERPSLSLDGTGDLWFYDPEGVILRLADSESEQRESVAGPVDPGRTLHVSADGTVWVWRGSLTTGGLSRFDGSDWTDFPLPGGGWRDEDQENHLDATPVMMQAAADGSVWLASWWGHSESPCDGITNFDGSTATTFLPDICVSAMDVAPDGSLWLLEHHPFTGRVFVITPEALAARR